MNPYLKNKILALLDNADDLAFEVEEDPQYRDKAFLVQDQIDDLRQVLEKMG
jgi:hypothetical protein